MNLIKLSPDDDIQREIDKIQGPATVLLKRGIYKQKIKVSRNDVTIRGESRDETVITWNDFARKKHADGMEYNTFRTYTACITGENVRLENLTIQNSNEDPVTAGQCVALSVNAKAFSAKGVRLLSTQDTLFLAPFPDDLVVRYSGLTDEGYYEGFIPRDELYMNGGALHCFKDCEICGTVDFIFGCAEAYFKNCRLVSLNDGRHTTYIAAPAHSLKQERGFTFADCSIEARGAAENSVYLARPWRDFGASAFINCRAGAHVNAQLFDRWNDTYRDKTARFAYAGMTFEGCADPVGWCRELSPSEAAEFEAACEAAMKKYGL